MIGVREEFVELENGIKLHVRWYEGGFFKDQEIGLIFHNEGKTVTVVRYRDHIEEDRLWLTRKGNGFYS